VYLRYIYIYNKTYSPKLNPTKKKAQLDYYLGRFLFTCCRPMAQSPKIPPTQANRVHLHLVRCLQRPAAYPRRLEPNPSEVAPHRRARAGRRSEPNGGASAGFRLVGRSGLRRRPTAFDLSGLQSCVWLLSADLLCVVAGWQRAGRPRRLPTSRGRAAVLLRLLPIPEVPISQVSQRAVSN
jgi:hypothetical protein